MVLRRFGERGWGGGGLIKRGEEEWIWDDGIKLDFYKAIEYLEKEKEKEEGAVQDQFTRKLWH